MNPKRALRRLRDDSRWVGLPPSRAERHRPALVGPAARTLLVTLAVLGLVAGLSSLAIGWTALHPARHASPTTTSSASPSPTAEAQGFRCGQAIPDAAFHGDMPGTAQLPHQRGSAELWLANYAAADARGRTTAVSATFAARAADQSTAARVRYRGALQVALLRGGRVVATGTGRSSTGAVGYDDTALVSAHLTSTDCATGRALPDGRYEIAATGVTASVEGSPLTPVNALKQVTLNRGVVVGGLKTVPAGPWRGSGVPQCGTAMNEAQLQAFVAASRARMAAAGLAVAITGSSPHANAEGWDFDAAVSDSSGRPVSVRSIGATTVIADGRIISAPASGTTDHDDVTASARAGGSVTLSSDAPTAGCGITADYTQHTPQLPNTVHTAYIEWGVTSTGIPIVSIVHYTESHGGRPKVVG